MRWLSCAALLLIACPAKVVPPPEQDAGSHEDALATCPDTPCVARAECVDHVCYSRDCGALECEAGQLCFKNRCVEAACAGVRCAFGGCVDGRCPTCPSTWFGLEDGGCEPKRPAGATCADAAECALGHCVEGTCCETACDGQCDRCATGRCTNRAQLDPGALGRECFPGRCPGGSSACGTTCIIDAHCADGGVCVGTRCEPLRPLAEPCTRPGECLSGQCIAGNCCDSACADGCGQCRLPDAGTTQGLCSPVAAGTLSTCGRYRCDGELTTCPSTCDVDTDCIASSWCDAQHRCVDKKPAPAACARGAECSTGRCNNGVCCTTSCRDGCRTCLGDAGCLLFPDGPADAGASCGPGQGSCWQGYCCDTPCSEACGQCYTGVCEPNPYQHCGVGNICGSSSLSCPNTCTNDQECQGWFWCPATTCEPYCESCRDGGPLGPQCCNCITRTCEPRPQNRTCEACTEL